MKNWIKWLIPVLAMFPLTVFAQGSLDPDAPPQPTMRTLEEIHDDLGELQDETDIPGVGISELPFTVNESGVYYLTDDLSSAVGGITVSASNVTLDLNGHRLSGLGTDCGDGIFVGTERNIVIRNGVIENWSEDGVNAGLRQNIVLENLLIQNNGGNGASTGNSARIRNVRAMNNSGVGLFFATGIGDQITAIGNGSWGVLASGGLVINSYAEDNGLDGTGNDNGIGGHLVRYSVSRSNEEGGISGQLVTFSQARQNEGTNLQKLEGVGNVTDD